MNNLMTHLNDKDSQVKFEQLIDYMENIFFKKVVALVNEDNYKMMMAKLTTERLPENERNLTDARTRIGTLLEYAIAYETNKILKDEGLDNYTMGHVLANQYPDLVLRNPNHFPVLRFEMKAIQSISEEKAANFDAQIRNIRKYSDLVCIMLWEWEIINDGFNNKEYPKIHHIYLFDAYELASLRNESWLASNSNYKAHKLIDVSGAYVPFDKNVENDNLRLKAEGGNIGKLMRFSIDRSNSVSAHTKNNYLKFKSETEQLGVKKISEKVARELKWPIQSKFNSEKIFNNHYKLLTATNKKSSLYIINTNKFNKKNFLSYKNDITDNSKVIYVITLSNKFKWNIYKIENNEYNSFKNGTKPKELYKEVQELI